MEVPNQYNFYVNKYDFSDKPNERKSFLILKASHPENRPNSGVLVFCNKYRKESEGKRFTFKNL